MESRASLLVVEDERDLATLLSNELSEGGFDVVVASTVAEAIKYLNARDFELAILDRNLPDGDGLDICSRIRVNDTLFPILMLTSRADESDQISGFKSGADDYITKPFSTVELIARVRALLRRSKSRGYELTLLHRGQLVLNRNQRRALLEGEDIGLTLTEFQLLLFLAERPGKLFSKEDLLREVWGYTSMSYDRTIHSHINRLRVKLKEESDKPRFVHTVWGKGYRFSSLEEL